MASNTSNYCGEEDNNAYCSGVARSKWKQRRKSPKLEFPKASDQSIMNTNLTEVIPPVADGVDRCKWKPRKISATRDFPKAFDQVSKDVLQSLESESNKIKPGVHTVQEVTVKESQNSDVSPFPKRPKVPLVHEFQKGISRDYKDNVGLVESSGSSIDNLVPLEMKSVSGVSSVSTEKLGLGYPKKLHETLETEENNIFGSTCTDKVMQFHERRVAAVRCYPPGCGINAVPLSEKEIDKAFTESKNHWLACESCNDHESSITTTSNEQTDACKRVNSHRRFSAVRCFPPGCGPDAEPLSEEELKKTITESKNHWLTCESCNDHESSIDIISNEQTDYAHKRFTSHRRVSAVRCFPPGCGPDAEPLVEEELRRAIIESKKHMLTCKSCGAE